MIYNLKLYGKIPRLIITMMMRITSWRLNNKIILLILIKNSEDMVINAKEVENYQNSYYKMLNNRNGNKDSN